MLQIINYDLKNNRQANILYQESLDKLTPARIMQFIRHHHDYQRPRLQMLDDYYQGFNTNILKPDNRRTDTEKADHRAVHSFGKYIADFQTSFSVGNAINVKHDEDKKLDKIEDANDFDSLNSDLFLDTTRYGRAYEYIYRGNDDIEHSVLFDPLETFVIYSLEVDPQPVMAVRYHLIEVVGDDNKAVLQYRIETWTADRYTLYKPTYLDSSMTIEQQKAIFAFPVVEYTNNRFKIGDFENVIPLIDLYDAAQSDTANYMSDLNDAMLVVKGDIDTLLQGSNLMGGIDPTDEYAAKKLAQDKMDMLKEMKNANMLLLKSGVDISGKQTTVDANYIHKEYDVNGTESYKSRLAHDIHKFSHTPDLTDENFAGNSSGVAMKYKVLGTIELASTKRKQFEKGLFKRYSIIYKLESKASGGMTTDPRTLKFTFRDNMPTDDLATIDQVTQAGAQLPQEYLYQFLPNISDPSEITEQLAKQQSEQVKQARIDYGAATDKELSDDG